jgi:hypothetical protein
MKDTVSRDGEGFDIVINGANRLFADLELSAIASAGFHEQNYRDDTVLIRTRKDGSLRTVLGPGSLEPSG